MLKIYYYFQAKIQTTELKLSARIEKKINEPYSSNLFYFRLITLNLFLVVLQIAADILKFIIILTRDPGVSFNIFFKQKELRSCPYSYHYFKNIQQKLRTFSFAGVAALILATAITSLILNLTFGGKAPGFAATYGWSQSDWSGQATSTAATHLENQSGWQWFFSKEDGINITASGTVEMIAINSTSTQTTDADFNAGTKTNVVTSGSGNDASVVLDFGNGAVTKTSASDFNTGTFTTTSVTGTGDAASVQLTLPGLSGTYVSSAINLGAAKNFDLQDFTFSTTIPAEIAGNRVQVQLSKDGTNWFGPGATSTRYFDTADCSVSGGIYTCDLTTTAGMLNGTSNLYYKVFLSSSDTNYAPTLNEITFNYYSQNEGVFESTSIDFGSKVTPQTISINPVSQTTLPEASRPLDSMTSFPSTYNTGGRMVYAGGDFVYVLKGYGQGFYRYSIIGNSWSQMANMPSSAALGSSLAYDGGDFIYGFPGDNTRNFYRYSITDNSWASMADTPAAVKNGGALTWAEGNYLYAFAGNDTDAFWQYDITLNTWSSLSNFPAIISNEGSNLVYPGYGDFIYANGGGSLSFYKYSISSNTWTQLTSLLTVLSMSGTSMVSDGRDYLYASTNQRYSISRNIWETPTSAFGYSGGKLAYVQSGNYIFAATYNGNTFSRYSLINDNDNAWQQMPDAPNKIGDGTYNGAVITYDGNGNFFAARGGGTSNFWKYNVATGVWTVMANTPASVANGTKLVSDHQGNLYLVLQTNALWKYTINTNSWTNLNISLNCTSMVYVKKYNSIYYYNGTNYKLYKYDLGSNLSSLVGDSNNLQPAIMTYDGRGGLYFMSIANDIKFWKYDIESNAWTNKASVNDANGGGGLTYYNGFIYAYRTYSSTRYSFGRYNVNLNSWSWSLKQPTFMASNGGYMPSMDDGYLWMFVGNNTTQFHRYRIPDNSIRYQVAVNNDNATWNYAGPDGTSHSYYESAVSSTLPITFANSRYLKYKAFFVSTNNSYAPTLNDVSISYNGIPGQAALISSPYNTNDTGNIFADIRWSNVLAENTSIAFQVRTSADGSTWNTWQGPDGTASSTFTDSAGSDAMPSNVTDGADDQYIQYKAILQSDGLSTPELTGVDVTYVVNATPEIELISTSTSISTSGLVNIDYKIRDTDTPTGITPGLVNVALEYCAAGCEASGTPTWITASTSFVTGDIGSLSVNQASTTTWTNHNLVWQPGLDIPGQYLASSTGFRVRLVVDDTEAANNQAAAETNAFTLDTTAPVVGPSGKLLKIDASVSQLNSEASANIYLDAIDDSVFEMKISIINPQTDQVSWDALPWQAYSSTSTLNLVTDPDTVYVQFKDEYNNITQVQAVTPAMPINMVIRDLTNIDTETYIEFVSWKASSLNPSDFNSYLIFRGEGTETEVPLSYELFSTITTSTRNYILDTSVTSGITYYYKIATKDNLENVSFSSEVVKDSPDGQGGTDNTSPQISGVEIISTSTQGAIIAWDTDELSDSVIGFSTVPADFFNNVGIDTMLNYSTSTALAFGYDPLVAVGRHFIVLSNLVPGTEYYFQVKSSDPEGNYSTDNNGGDGYTFSTKPGPIISGVTQSRIDNLSATIVWDTDKPADSLTVYSIHADMNEPTEVRGSIEQVNNHQVEITNLLPGTKYYYYVASTDEDGNQAVDKNTINGSEVLYSFTTTNDLVAPLISNVRCNLSSDTGLAVRWGTNEPSTSWVNYGIISGEYASSTDLDANYNTDHSVDLINLTSSSTYYFTVSSADSSGNNATSTEYSCDTIEKLTEETEVLEREEAAKQVGISQGLETGIIQGRATSGGGGTIVIDKTDKIAPIISGIEVRNIKANSAIINWKTNESADSFVEYVSNDMKKYFGRADLTNNHQAILEDLIPSSQYVYKVKSKDSSGNLAVGSDLTFSTPSLIEQLTSEGKTQTEIGQITSGGNSANETLIEAAQQAMALVAKVAGNVSLGVLENTLFSQYDTIEKLSQAIPAPVLGGEPGVVTTATTATIAWRTDKDSNSVIALVPDNVYSISADKNDPYTRLDGDANVKTQTHLVKVTDLKPETTYHYQLRSKADLGPEGKSRDFTFTTKGETLEISNYAIQNVSAEKAIFRWITNTETNSELSYMPYRNNRLSTDEAKTVSDKAMTTVHELAANDFEGGTIYQVELIGKDVKGNQTSKLIETFSTSKDDLPPVISQIQTESALSQGKTVKVQSVISWYTNEPTIGYVAYEKGVITGDKEFSQKIPIEVSYGKKHVAVITKFEPGTVYSFRVYANDSAGNTTISKTFTVLTPKQKESVFQLILKNFESTFGWVGKLNQ